MLTDWGAPEAVAKIDELGVWGGRRRGWRRGGRWAEGGVGAGGLIYLFTYL